MLSHPDASPLHHRLEIHPGHCTWPVLDVPAEKYCIVQTH